MLPCFLLLLTVLAGNIVSYLVELTEGVADVGCSAYVSGGAVASFQPVGLDTRERIDCGIDFLIAGVFCLSLLLKRLRAPCCCCLSQRQISRAIVVIEHDHHSLDNGWPQCGLTCPAPAHVIDITPCFYNLQFKIKILLFSLPVIILADCSKGS